MKHCECWRRYICRVFNDEWNRILVSSEWRGETAGTASPCSAHFRLKAFTALDETDGDGTRQSREMHLLLHHVIHHIIYSSIIHHVIHHMIHSYYSSHLSSWCYVFIIFIIIYSSYYIFMILCILHSQYYIFIKLFIHHIYAFLYSHHTTYHHIIHSS